MGLIREQSVKGTIYSYLGVILGFITVAILFPRFLSTAEIGALNLLVAYSMIIAQIASLGFPGAIIKFFPLLRGNREKEQAFLGALTLVTLLGGILFLALFIPFRPLMTSWNENSAPIFTSYLFMLVPLTLAQLAFINFEAYANAIYRASLGIFIKEFLQRILILVPFLAVVFGWWSFEIYINAYVIALVMSAFMLIGYLFYIKSLKMRLSAPAITGLDWTGMRSLSLYTWLAGFSGLGLQRIDGILVNAVYNESLTGIYTTTFYFGTLVLIPGRVVNRISHTLISDALSLGDLGKVEDIYRKTSLVQWLLGLALLAGLWVHLDNIFRLLPEEFAAGRWVIIWIGLGNLIRMSGGAVDGIIAYSKHYRINTLLVVLLLVLTVVFVWLLLGPYGISGAAFGTFGAVMIFHLARTFFVWKFFHLQPFGLQHFYALLLAVFAVFMTSLLPYSVNLFLDLVLRSLLFVFIFGLPVYLLKLSPVLNQYIEKFLPKKTQA